MVRLPLVTGAWCLFAAAAAAQLPQPTRPEPPLRELPSQRHLPLWSVHGRVQLNRGLRIVDLDGDGDLDLTAYRLGWGGTRVENIGELRFVDRSVPGPRGYTPPTPFYGDTAVGDLDGDGQPDVIYAGFEHYVALTSNGVFAPFPEQAEASRAAALGDVDGDGDLDLVLGKGGGAQNRLLLNNGVGQFRDVTTDRMPVDADSTSSVEVGDLDGDGDPDLVIGNSGEAGTPEPDRIYLNDGLGRFSDATMALLPNLSTRTEALVLGDVDLDGDLDLVLGIVGQNRLYLNDGFGRMLDGTGLRMPVDGDATRDIEIADVDGDGDPDLVTGNLGPNRLYLNDGVGGFAIDHRSSLAGADDTSQVAAGDLDGDGDADIVFGNGGDFSGGTNTIHVNDGRGGFQLITPSRWPWKPLVTRAVVLVDVEGDGDLDAVLANQKDGFPFSQPSGSAQNLLYLNAGTGEFDDQSALRMPIDSDDTRAIGVGDVDGDGDQDLLLGSSGSSPQNRLYLNDGSGRFVDGTATRLPPDADQSAAVAVGDVDGDGDLDVVLGNEGTTGEQNRLYLNDGTGSFTDATQRLPALRDITRAVMLTDVDGDADLDLVFGNQGQSRLHVNQGDGTFVDRTSVALPQLDLDTHALAVIDGDGDGDPDLLLGNAGATSALLENDGGGLFSASGTSLSGSYTLAVGDLDLDGDPDIMLGARNGAAYAMLNDGTGAFFLDGTGVGHFARSIALGDVDGDRDLDVVVGAAVSYGTAGLDSSAAVLGTNLHVQISTPYSPRTSSTYTLEIRANRFLQDGATFTIVAGLSLDLAPNPLELGPLGSLYLETAGLILLPSAAMSDTGRPLLVDLEIPRFVTLRGRTVYAQAAVINDANPMDVMLTGYTADWILR